MTIDERVLDALHNQLNALFSTFQVGPQEAVQLLEQVLDEMKVQAAPSAVPASVDDLFDDIAEASFAVDETPVPAPVEIAEAAAFRRTTRITASERVTVSHNGRREEHITRDLSEGGLYLEMKEPLALATMVELTVPHGGNLRMPAIVVRVDDEGVGFEFLEPLDDDVRRELLVYLDQLKKRVDEAEVRRADEDEAAALLERLEQSDIYGALELPIDMPNGLVLAKLNAQIDRLAPDAPEDSVVHDVRGALERFRTVFSSIPRRLAYDFINDHVDAEQRIARGEDVSTLRGVWSRVYPARAASARTFTQLALEHADHARFAQACEHAERALDGDPFQPKLREAYASWLEYRALTDLMRVVDLEACRDWARARNTDEAELRRIWGLLHPARIERAKLQAKRALQATSAGRFDEAVKSTERAYELDPFNKNLPAAIKRWRETAEARA